MTTSTWKDGSVAHKNGLAHASANIVWKACAPTRQLPAQIVIGVTDVYGTLRAGLGFTIRDGKAATVLDDLFSEIQQAHAEAFQAVASSGVLDERARARRRAHFTSLHCAELH